MTDQSIVRTLTFALQIASTINIFDLQAAESPPPNVVIILVDDLGWSDVGFNRSKVYDTPNEHCHMLSSASFALLGEAFYFTQRRKTRNEEANAITTR